jgi:hypothetical protein
MILHNVESEERVRAVMIHDSRSELIGSRREFRDYAKSCNRIRISSDFRRTFTKLKVRDYPSSGLETIRQATPQPHFEQTAIMGMLLEPLLFFRYLSNCAF